MNDTAYHHCNRAGSGCGIGCMDRDDAAAYFGAMIRSVLTVLAAVALMLVSLTANASATPMTTGNGHMPCMSMSGGHGVTVAPCSGMGDPACAFACAGKSQPPAPSRLDSPLAFGAIMFLPASAVSPAGHRPGQLERPPRSRQS